MSLQLINQYYNELLRIQQYSGSHNEDTLKGAFANLINGLARPKNLELVREVAIKSDSGNVIRPDGILRSVLQFDYGYWESKDSKDNLTAEIAFKFKRGYPDSNILFEDTQTAVLFQAGRKFEANMREPEQLLELLQTFISFERPELAKFNEAIAQFSRDLPQVLNALRAMIEAASAQNPAFIEKTQTFLKLCRKSINPNLDLLDVREMLIQHILTEEIFVSVFNNADYHRENNIAQSLYEVEKTFFRGQTKQNLLADIRPYYNTVKARANEMVGHADKQKFLKVIYENFYRSYHPEAADRLGIVYTPNEIVDFMIAGTDFLLEQHFYKTLGSKNVEILDPCTGTGTFITQLIEHLPKQQLAYKYQHEIHANEMALLPYYVANLNIEAVYQQKMGTFQEFKNLCFVDTLDNIAALDYKGKQSDMFGALSLENVERIKRQNEKTISVIIGNPPYNAKQENYNFQNANRAYQDIDKRIKETYIKQGTAQNQIVVYDMYTRFYRWASDRIQDNQGIICFVSNSSFIDARAFDGFRKSIQNEFDFAYIVDFGGDIRKLSGKDGIWMNEEHTIFGTAAAVGIAVMFLVKKGNKTERDCRIRYVHPCDIRATRREKFEWIQNLRDFDDVDFELINPDRKCNWINRTENDFDELIPLIDKEVKAGKSQQAIFQLFSLGLDTKCDAWLYDFDKNLLCKKAQFYHDIFNLTVEHPNFEGKFQIKWFRNLDRFLKKRLRKSFDFNKLVFAHYRPYTKTYLYLDSEFNAETYHWFKISGYKLDNIIIGLNTSGNSKPFHCLASKYICDLHFTGDSQCLPLYRYENSQRVENITDWALQHFRTHYTTDSIEKLDIFHYVYAVLHDPCYRQKYAQNLKRDFPRIPLYKNFSQWAEWGKHLMHLHLSYETASLFPLQRDDKPLKNSSSKPKVKLKSDKLAGKIEIDEVTTLSGIPMQAWQYQLGNRSALEWVLDQYKEKTPSDKTILEKFNNYQLADYKEHVIGLLQRVCTVSIETVKIIELFPRQ